MDPRDWFDWHRHYDEAGSDLAGRLGAVRARIVDALDAAPPGPIRAISLCAGQGRDILGALVSHPRRAEVAARLVELDPRNAEVAASAARAAGLTGVAVVVGDASSTTAYDGAVPADLVLVCGVFGHASDDDIHGLIGQLPSLCSAGATVIWTRGGFEPDLRPTIRRWFADEGFDEVGFDAADEGGWGVGVARLAVAPRPYRAGLHLFTFLDVLPGR